MDCHYNHHLDHHDDHPHMGNEMFLLGVNVKAALQSWQEKNLETSLLILQCLCVCP